MMSFAGDAYRFFTSFRMTRLRFVVILSKAKDLYVSNTINIMFLLLQYTTVVYPYVEHNRRATTQDRPYDHSLFIPNSQFKNRSFSIIHFPFQQYISAPYSKS